MLDCRHVSKNRVFWGNSVGSSKSWGSGAHPPRGIMWDPAWVVSLFDDGWKEDPMIQFPYVPSHGGSKMSQNVPRLRIRRATQHLPEKTLPWITCYWHLLTRQDDAVINANHFKHRQKPPVIAQIISNSPKSRGTSPIWPSLTIPDFHRFPSFSSRFKRQGYEFDSGPSPVAWAFWLFGLIHVYDVIYVLYIYIYLPKAPGGLSHR